MTEPDATNPLVEDPLSSARHMPLRPSSTGCRILLPHPYDTPVPSRAGTWFTCAVTLRPLNDPSESPPSPSGNTCYAPFAQPAKLHSWLPLQQPSVNTVETPENSARMLTDHTGAACPESGCRWILLNYL